MLTLDEWLDRFRASCKREHGQTMAGSASSVSVCGAEGAVNRVIGIFPG